MCVAGATPGCAVATRIAATSSLLRLGLIAFIIAAMPATNGAEALVPENTCGCSGPNGVGLPAASLSAGKDITGMFNGANTSTPSP